MRRRELFKWLCVLPAAAVPVAPKRHGCLTLDGHRAHRQATGEFLHVWLDGQDVTGDCRLAHDEQGYVHVVARSAADHKRWQQMGGLMTAINGRIFALRGNVVIAPGPAFVRAIPRERKA